tara:strand:+ start:73326 stop:73577 length:252 start_codon:yes stop_codon:yes gene_type:complete
LNYLELPSGDRAALARDLLLSLDGLAETSDIDSSWPDEIRRATLKSFPYAVIFQIVDPESVVAPAVAYLSRKPSYWLHRIADW